ncbi:class A beta-lactamase [Nitratireductor sp.]|uniref:class A beta-lactamase n=1 Tax=Nitratireductor sp. TaxID=1872084 RepID=UPI00262082DC|nr:class A beta-lactamase [Nitratireductor sp.]MCV0378501.1 class A beta-lactamase [Nitratireductor sp.]
MNGFTSVLSRLAAGLVLGFSLFGSASAQTPQEQLSTTVSRIENALSARIGVVVRDTGSDWSWSHRAEERFLMNSTVKALICGAVLAGADEGTLTLDEMLPIRKEDMVSYSPVTEKQMGKAMSVAALCLATLDISDNAAANLLLKHLGGPEKVTTFLRGIGDTVSRLDRLEPELNTYAPGDPRDTSTPKTMVDTWQNLLLGDALKPASRAQIIEWMSHGGVTGALLRASLPDDWAVADKSGAGSHTRNLVAMVTPPGRAPWLVAIYVSDTDVDFATRNQALKDVGAAVAGVLKSR